MRLVLIIEDVDSDRARFRATLAGHPGFRIVAEAGDAQTGLALGALSFNGPDYDTTPFRIVVTGAVVDFEQTKTGALPSHSVPGPRPAAYPLRNP